MKSIKFANFLNFYAIALAVTVIFATTVMAADDIFTVPGVIVEKEAENGSDARRLAREEAEQVAFDKLIHSIITDQDYSKLPKLRREEISALAKGFEVSDEKISGNKYKADFTISFYPDKIKKLLEDSQANFVENKGVPTLVLPILQENGSSELWNTANPWWQSWEKVAARSHLVPMILPLADIDDLNLITAEQAQAGDYEALKILADKYQAKDVLVVVAQYNDTKFNGRPALDVAINLVDKDGTERRQTSFDAEYGESKDDFMVSSVTDIVNRIENDWMKKSEEESVAASEKEESSNVILNIHINSLKEWLEINKRISSIQDVGNIEVLGLSAKEAKIKLSYKSDFETFSNSLKRGGFDLKKSDHDNEWILETSKG